MNIQANARTSSIVRNAQSNPVLRAYELFTAQELSATRFFASMPHRAQAVVDYLEPKAQFHVFDSDLRSILRTAKTTIARSSKRRTSLN